MENTNENNTNVCEEENVKELTGEELRELLAEEKRKGRFQGISFALVGLSAIAVIISLVLAFSGKSNNKASFNSGLIDQTAADKIDSLWRIVDKHFLWEDKIDEKAARDNIYKGILNSLGDQYSVYYTEEEYAELMEEFDGEYSGIGAYISQNPDTMEAYISRPMPSSPAEEAGLVPNDYIYEVDGENVVGQDLNLIVSKIKGPEGTSVDLGIKHENQGEIETITVLRRKIEIIRLESEMLEDNIGYIWVYEFEDKTDSQFNKAYEELKSQGMKGLIIDLRGNPGGYVDVAVRMCDKFLSDGTIIYLKTKDTITKTYTADAECEKIPIVILTNEESASAAEIFAGALKDHAVAKIVGKTSFGKGIVQDVLQLSDGSGIKITSAEYYLPNDECIHGIGITPDYEVDLDYEAYKEDKTNDSQKKKAIEVMKELIK